MSIVGVAVGVSAAAAVAGTAYSLSGAGQAKQPDLASSSKEVLNAQAAMLPEYRRLAAAAQMGNALPVSEEEKKFQVEEQRRLNEIAQLQSSDISFNHYLARQKQKELDEWRSANKISRPDFTGYGQADIEGEIARQMAAGQLDLSKRYSPEFIRLALEQEKLADPEGYLARQKENELIQGQVADKKVNPIAADLQSQVEDQIASGSNLSSFDKAALDQAVQQSLAARGGAAPQADFAAPLETGAAGEKRREAAIANAGNLMTSGTTTADVEYRKKQQDMANLAALISGQTPVTQFKSLSGAQAGATPVFAGNQMPLAGQNSLAMGAQSAANSYAAKMNQPNPWMTGLSSVINLASAGGNLYSATQKTPQKA